MMIPCAIPPFTGDQGREAAAPRAALKFRNVGLSRARTTWAVWGAQRALYKQNAFLLASHHAGVVSQAPNTARFRSHRAIPRTHTPRLRRLPARARRVARGRQVEPSAARPCGGVAAPRRDRSTQPPPPPPRHRGVEGAGAEGAAADGVGRAPFDPRRAGEVDGDHLWRPTRRARRCGAVGRMRNTKLAAGFLGWLGAVEAIATAKALMALCVAPSSTRYCCCCRVKPTSLPPPLSTLSPPPIPTGDCFGVALVDGIRRRLPPDAQMRALVHAPRVDGIGARVGSDG